MSESAVGLDGFARWVSWRSSSRRGLVRLEQLSIVLLIVLRLYLFEPPGGGPVLESKGIRGTITETS